VYPALKFLHFLTAKHAVFTASLGARLKVASGCFYYTMAGEPLGSRPYGVRFRFLQSSLRIVAPTSNKGPFHSPIPRDWAHPIHHRNAEEEYMLRWALGFFIVALIAALLGFTGISVAAAGIAKILFYLFLILFLVTLMGHLLRRS
jgi:uncharacterized membrane protein YtjA (UPF0391 family)